MCSVLLVWNIILTVQVHRLSTNTSDGKVVVHNKVDTNDISSVIASVKTSVVSVESHHDVYSGVVLEKDDESLYIVTVAEAVGNTVEVYFDSGYCAQAEVLGVDEDTDLCVLCVDVDFDVDGFSLKELDEVSSGENVIGIGGRTNGIGNRVISSGVCSEEGLYEMHSDSTWLATMYETDMDVDTRQYGGALVDLNGNLLGVLVNAPSTSSSRMEYAISSAEVKKVYEDIRKDGAVTRGSLGIVVRAVNEMESYEKNQNGLNLDATSGLFILNVPETSCAYDLLYRGDRLVKMDNTSIDSLQDLRNALYKKQSGDEVKLSYIRNNESDSVTVVLQ